MNISDELIDDIIKVISSKCECKVIKDEERYYEESLDARYYGNRTGLACENCRILDRIIQEKMKNKKVI
jgi:hypothetical protein